MTENVPTIYVVTRRRVGDEPAIVGAFHTHDEAKRWVEAEQQTGDADEETISITPTLVRSHPIDPEWRK
jgi:hypothetical protein